MTKNNKNNSFLFSKVWFSNRRARWRKIASVHHQQQQQQQQQLQQSHHLSSAPSPLLFTNGPPTATSSVNLSVQSPSSSRLHFNPFCLQAIDVQAPSNGQLSSSASIFHPSNECTSSANSSAILFANQQHQHSQSTPSSYIRYTNGLYLYFHYQNFLFENVFFKFFLDYEQIYRSTAANFSYSPVNSNNIMMSGQVLPPPPPPTSSTTSSSPFYTPNMFDMHNIYL